MPDAFVADSAQVLRRGRGHGGLERVTVNLTPRSSKALEQAAELTGDSKTDIVNRALQLYEFIEQIFNTEGHVYVRTGPDGDLERLRLL